MIKSVTAFHHHSPSFSFCDEGWLISSTGKWLTSSSQRLIESSSLSWDRYQDPFVWRRLTLCVWPLAEIDSNQLSRWWWLFNHSFSVECISLPQIMICAVSSGNFLARLRPKGENILIHDSNDWWWTHERWWTNQRKIALWRCLGWDIHSSPCILIAY